MIIKERSKAYTEAGVSIDAGEALVSRIKKIVKTTHVPGVISEIGGFGGLFKPDLNGMEEPLLVGTTDGVGTKLKLAFQFDKHDTVGIDLVAMSVNDILVQGAKPLFFLDYFATGKLDVSVAEQVISGIADGCRQAGCALLGGETAEMPDIYAPGEYDLAGFCLGIVDNHLAVDGSGVRMEDALIGLPSSGLHSNGFSLVRKILKESGLTGDDIFPGTESKVKDILLSPTIIYSDAVRNIMRDYVIKGMVHITGGGFYLNIPRILPQGVVAQIDFNWPISPLFKWLKEEGNLTWPEMLQIFNCGIGFIMVVSAADQGDILNRLDGLGIKGQFIGKIRPRTKKDTEEVDISLPE